jgi:hypothetical protein
MTYTINGTGNGNSEIENTFFRSLEAARQAWIDAGSPTTRGSSVWVTEHNGAETVRTITIG